MTKDEALKLALEALEKSCPAIRRDFPAHGKAITSLRQALSEAQLSVNENSHAIEQTEKQEPIKIDGNTSDGYHTFNELYEFRKAYNVALFNEWASGGKCSVHKSWRHHDGELCFGGGWFIVVAVLPQGQISNHYEAKDWNLFAIPEVERALFEFDGHTGNDVIERLEAYTTPQPQRDTWKNAAIRLGEELSSFGPDGYYDMTAEQWLSWALDQQPNGKHSLPQPQREWVGLTDEEIVAINDQHYNIAYRDFDADVAIARAIEAKLKEKNT